MTPDSGSPCTGQVPWGPFPSSLAAPSHRGLSAVPWSRDSAPGPSTCPSPGHWAVFLSCPSLCGPLGQPSVPPQGELPGGGADPVGLGEESSGLPTSPSLTLPSDGPFHSLSRRKSHTKYLPLSVTPADPWGPRRSWGSCSFEEATFLGPWQGCWAPVSQHQLTFPRGFTGSGESGSAPPRGQARSEPSRSFQAKPWWRRPCWPLCPSEAGPLLRGLPQTRGREEQWGEQLRSGGSGGAGEGRFHLFTEA